MHHNAITIMYINKGPHVNPSGSIFAVDYLILAQQSEEIMLYI